MNALRRLVKGPDDAAQQVAIAPTDAVPDLQSVPAFAEAERLEIELQQRLTELQAQRAELAKRVLTGSDLMQGNEAPNRVAAILGRPLAPAYEGDRERLKVINDDIAALKEATELAQKARREAWVQASAEICEGMADRHRELLLTLAGHLIEAQNAWLAYDDFLQQFRAKNIAYGRLRSATPDFLGPGPRINRSELRLWLRELCASGFLEKDQLPEGCR